MDPPTEPITYKKMIEAPQKERGQVKPKPNQREVYLEIQENLLKAKPMKEESTVAWKSSGKYCKYHQDYDHTTS